jgi:EmrB/QacA subfamily drug resistance transporter
MAVVERSDTARDAPVMPARPNAVMAVLCLSGLTYAVLASVLVPALPTIRASLGASETSVTWLLTAFLLGASIGTGILGRLGDMHGKRRLLLWTLGILAAATLVGALAKSLGVLIAARFVQGASGGVFPLGFGIIRDEFPPGKIAAKIGLMSSVLGVGGGLGVVLSGVIAQHFDWHWLLWIPFAACVLAGLLTWRYVPESPVRIRGRVNWLSAALMALGVTAILVGISMATRWGWGSPRTLGLIAGGLVVCAAWVRRELHSPEPLVDMAMMRLRAVWSTNAAAFLIAAGMYSCFVVIPQLVQLPKSTGFGFGGSVTTAGLFLLPCTVGQGLTSGLAGIVAARYGSRFGVIAGALIIAAGFAWLTFFHASTADVLLTSTLIGLGIGLAFAALGNVIVEAVPPHQTGVATGMNTVSRTMGGALGGQLSATFIAGHVIHGVPTVDGFVMTFVMATGFLLLAAATVALAGRTSTRRRVSATVGLGSQPNT